MDINEIKSNLKMENLYFSSCSIKRSTIVTNGEYSVDLQRKIAPIDEHVYDVELTLTIEKDDLQLIIISNANFTYEANDYSSEETIVKRNTVAIMFPFIRSQVSLMTSQPGMTPIVLPPINTAKIV